MLIFGQPWNAPICDDADRYPEVPTYADCMRCGCRFAADDSGVLMPYAADTLDARYIVGTLGDGRAAPFAWLVGEHRECHLSGVVGHMVRVCACTGWDPFARATALEVQRRVDAGGLRV